MISQIDALWISWQGNKPASVVTSSPNIQNPAMYTYSYDSKYQLTGATWGTPSFTSTPSFTPGNTFSEKNISYDPNGNIMGLQRTNVGGTLSDNFSSGYTYQAGTNQLTKVHDATLNADYANYTYDEIGRLKSEVLTGAPNPYYLKYDVTGKITGIYSDAAMTVATETYTYDESGNRIKTVNANGTTYYVYDASSNVMAIYTGTTPVITEVPVYGNNRLGAYTVSSNDYVYELRDNVGSVRVVINGAKNSSGQADIVTYDDYYPYGSIAQSGGTNYRYDYQGAYSEKDPVTGWNNFLLRMYDGKIGRWLSFDPAGQFYSPYEGMGNNPVTSVDPTGAVDTIFHDTSTGITTRIPTNDDFDLEYYGKWETSGLGKGAFSLTYSTFVDKKQYGEDDIPQLRSLLEWLFVKKHFYWEAKLAVTHGSIGGRIFKHEGYEADIKKSNLVVFSASTDHRIQFDNYLHTPKGDDNTGETGGLVTVPLEVPIGLGFTADNQHNRNVSGGLGPFGYEGVWDKNGNNKSNFVGLDVTEGFGGYFVGLDVTLKAGIRW